MIKIATRELKSDEFSLAEHLWEDCHGQKADPVHDRLFGVFIDGKVSASARYVKHADGGEMDCVVEPETENGKGYARDAVATLMIHCDSGPVYRHSTRDLIPLYPTRGFLPIPEDQLPPSSKERFSFCLGTMKDCNISPMVRKGAVVRPALPLPPEGIPRGG